MFEDSLFGHVRGAFTGAASDSEGCLLEADKGTAFFDEGSGLSVSMHADESPEPVVCDLSAIPADQRERHFELARSLLFADERRVRDLENGMEFELPADRLADTARFVENERRCCRHLAFTLEVPARGASIVLQVSGPGARDELRALLR